MLTAASKSVARLDDDGYLFIVDRLKDMIITGGENVYSKEVEDVLSAHPAVSEVAVYGIPHGEWGETVVAAIVPKIRHVLNADDVRKYLAGRLPDTRYRAKSTSPSDCPERQQAKSKSICCDSRASEGTPFRRMAPNTGKTFPLH
jgi:feruloyl-CoA synthase